MNQSRERVIYTPTSPTKSGIGGRRSRSSTRHRASSRAPCTRSRSGRDSRGRVSRCLNKQEERSRCSDHCRARSPARSRRASYCRTRSPSRLREQHRHGSKRHTRSPKHPHRASRRRSRSPELHRRDREQRSVRPDIQSDHRARSRSQLRASASGSGPCATQAGAKGQSINITQESPSLTDLVNILKAMSNSGLEKLGSVNNTIPEFDPCKREQTMTMWLHKVNECATIYSWSEKQIIHFALPKLKGVAQRWYEGLPSVLFSWTEWQEKLMSAFPSDENYGQMLSDMLAKRARFNDSLEEYYYEKLVLINRCGISGRRAVECILHGIDDRSVRLGAEAAQFDDPNKLLSYLRSARNVKSNTDRRPVKGIAFKQQGNPNRSPRNVRCSNCRKDGHFTSQCTLPIKKCTRCNRIGHEAEQCYAKIQTDGKSVMCVKKGNDIVSEASTKACETSQKYFKVAQINGHPIEAFIDLGSECSIIQLSHFLNISNTYSIEGLPTLRGFGNSAVNCIGKRRVQIIIDGIEASLDLLIVPDSVMHVPLIIGQSFTEQAHVVIRKTRNRLEISQLQQIDVAESNKINLYCTNIVTFSGTIAIAVYTDSSYRGEIYVEGGLRMLHGVRYSLLSGLFIIENDGKGCIVVNNTSSATLTLPKDLLLARGRVAREESTMLVMNVMTPPGNKSGFIPITDSEVNFGDKLSAMQKTRLVELLNKYRSCFALNLGELGTTSVGQMTIDLNDNEPVVYRPYRLSFSEKDKVREMISELLQNDIIRPSTSAYASPIVVVRKKTGELRLCIDYRALNKKTVKENYPMPLIDDQLDVLSGNKFYTTLDLASGYYQISIKECDKHKTGFVTPNGNYEFNRMPFGLANAPATFQRIMNQVVGTLRHKEALAYLDDVIIPSKNIDEGMASLETVLSLFLDAGLTLKLSKCTFFGSSVDYLGFEVSSAGIRPGQRKIEAVEKFPVPQNQHNVRQFLGLASFFRRFVPRFSTIAKPLTQLLKKDSKWIWSAKQDDSFRQLQAMLAQRPVLALYNPQAHTELHTDACKIGLAGILLQKDEHSMLRPIAYFSRQTTPEEQNYSSYDLETLAVVASLQKFRVYLVGVPFKVLTDCNSLRATFEKRDMIPRVARWWEQMQEFNFTIEYRAGQHMAHVDALSRNPVPEIVKVMLVTDSAWLSTVQTADDEIQKTIRILNDPELDNVVDIKTNFKVKNNKLFRITPDGDRWVVPKGVRWQVVKQNHDDIGHFALDKTLDKIKATFWFSRMRHFVKKYINSCLECAYSKSSGGKKPGCLHPIEKVDIPFDTVHADHVGPFVRSSRGNMYVLALIDAFTRYIYLKPVRNTKAQTTIKVFREFFGIFGVPRRIISNRGTSFTCDAFKKFVNDRNIKHVLNAVSTPRANGQIERYNRTLVESLTAICVGSAENKWDDYLPDVQWGLNNTFNRGINHTPSEALFGTRLTGASDSRIRSELVEDIISPDNQSLPEIRDDINDHVKTYQEAQKKVYDEKRCQAPEYKEGDLVRIERQVPATGSSRKLIPKFQGPYRITKVLDMDRFLIEDTPLTRKGNRSYSTFVSVDKIKPWLNFKRPHVDFSSDEDE